MTLLRWIEKLGDIDSLSLASRIVKEDPGLAAETVAHEIRHLKRGRAQRTEDKLADRFFSALTQASTAQIDGAIPIFGEPIHLMLPRSRFALGDGNSVSWGEATLSQHEKRIGMLRAMWSGISETIKRHETAITLLQQTGAKCLNELLTEQPRAAIG